MKKRSRYLILLITFTALLWGRSNAMLAQQYWDATKTSGTYTLNNDHYLANPVSLTGNLTITSNGSRDYTIIRTAHQPVGSYENAFSAMFITNGYTLTIKGTSSHRVILDGGAVFNTAGDARTGWKSGYQGRIICVGNNGGDTGALVLEYVTLQNAYARRANNASYPSWEGGAILFYTLTKKTSSLTNVTIQGCHAVLGSAVKFHGMDRTTATFTNVTIQKCMCEEYPSHPSGQSYDPTGGTIRENGSCETILTLDGCTIQDNKSNAGAGVYWNAQGLHQGTAIQQTARLTIKGDTKIINNVSTSIGGGLHLSGGATAEIQGATITGNSAASRGGGIDNHGKLTILGLVTIKNNTKDGTANNLFIGSDATWNYVTIGNLTCGSSIGITTERALSDDSNTGKYVPFAYNGTAGSGAWHCARAYKRGCFFHDANQYSVFAFGTNVGSYYNPNTVYLMETWLTNANASGTTTSADGNTITVNNAAGLAYIAKQVKAGNTYEGKTIKLSADIDLSGHYWEPIGIWVSNDCGGIEDAFLGTFDGQGHTITNAKSILPFSGLGVFGHIRTKTIVKNTFVKSCNFNNIYYNHTYEWDDNCSHSIGGLVGRMYGGTVYNCGTIGATVGGEKMVGGLVGSAANSSNVHSCYVINPTISAGTNQGGMVGMLESSSKLQNCFANTTLANSLVGVSNSGTAIKNCYVRGTSGFGGTISGSIDYCYASAGSASGTNGVYSAATSTYQYRDLDEQVTATNDYVPTRSNKQLVETLNNWVDAQTDDIAYSRWVRPTTTIINDDYPVLRMNDFYAVASSTGTNNLYYGTATGSTNNLLSTYTTSSDAICLYKSLANISDNTSSSAKLYIDPDVAVTQAGSNNAYVGVWLDNSAGTGGANPSQGGTDNIDWHLFSSALENLPLGFSYNTSGYTPGHGNTPPAVTFTTPKSGYFPTNLASYYSEWDFYSYSEPDYHWVNMKRNSDDHWHSDYDYWQINYTNEDHFVSGRGYLVATAQDCFLQAYGTLKKGDGITHPLSYTAGIAYTTRDGFNVLGNPYQSYLDFDQFAHTNSAIWEGGVTQSGYIVMDEDQGGYAYYAHGASDNHYGANRYLHPHQGFIVMAGKTGLTATFNENMRSVSGTGSFREERLNYALVNLIVTEGNGSRDLCTVELGRPDKGGLVKAKGVKAGKGSIYCHYDDEDYAIVFTQPGISEVGIRFETPDDDAFTLTWDMENADFHYLHLIDNKTGSDIDCLTTSEYCFSASPDDYKSRFRLVFGYTGIEEPEAPEPVEGPTTFAFQMGDELVVNGEGTLQVVDMMGRVLQVTSLHDTQSRVALPNVSKGVYILRLNGRNGTKTQKMIIE